MKVPALKGLIRRRILLNYRIDPDLVSKLLPDPFHPQLHNGYAIAGICLIRLEEIRPRGLPAVLGIASENSAHRFAVTWDCEGKKREGVYINQRHTNSRLNAFLGGRVFPGYHELVTFAVKEERDSIQLTVHPKDEPPLVRISCRESSVLPKESVFTLEESSRFFEEGSLGYSPAGEKTNRLEGLRLQTQVWKVSPLTVDSVESSFFDDPARFPTGSIQFDHALLMRNIPHCWLCEDSIS